MCGIVACLLKNREAQCAPLLLDSLIMLQHRGQDAAGIATSGDDIRIHKGNGLVSQVFKGKDLSSLPGRLGVGHCRYPTAGSLSSEEAQPFYAKVPFGMCLVHNGSLTNTDELTSYLIERGHKCKTTSDSECLLQVLVQELFCVLTCGNYQTKTAVIFRALERMTQICHGGYAMCALIQGVGILGFRDKYGIRPCQLGTRSHDDYMFASESAAIENNGFDLIDDLDPGEAVLVDMEGQVHRHKCCETATLTPCIFEYVYFARADSSLDGVSVYAARLNMGRALAKKVKRLYPDEVIDAIIPIPDTSRAAALQMAESMGIPYRDGFVKNRYIARTFIMAGQEARKKNVRKKLSPLRGEFAGKSVLLVDDSIVRGNTASQVVKMVRRCGAKRVYLCSASPGVRHPNIYGIDMPATDEYVAYNRNEQQVAEAIGADWVVYQDLGDLEECVRSLNPTRLKKFDSSCFNGRYVTGDVDDAFLQQLARKRSAARAICLN